MLKSRRNNKLDHCIVWNAHNTVFGCLRLTVGSVICRAVNPRSTSQKIWGEVSYMECTGQGNDFELIPAVKIETRYPAEGSLGNEFPSTNNHCRVMVA